LACPRLLSGNGRRAALGWGIAADDRKLAGGARGGRLDLCVVSNTIDYLRDKTPEESLAFVRRWNQYGAEIQQKHNKK
jgi:hypothetical protein